MICCVVIGCVIAFAVRLWRLMTLQPLRRAETFPPVAKRLGPGLNNHKTRQGVKEAFNGKYTTNKLLMFYAGTIGFYCVGIALLLSNNRLQLVGEPSDWFYRNMIYGCVLIYFLLLGVLPNRKKKSVTRQQFKGAMVTIVGIVFTVLSVVDLHMFQVIAPSGLGHHHHHDHAQLFLSPHYLSIHVLLFAPIIFGQFIFHANSLRSVNASH